MSDLVSRLRHGSIDDDLLDAAKEAADRIEALEKQLLANNPLIDEAIARIEADEALLRQAFTFLLRLSPGDICAASHHYKDDRHEGTDCPQLLRHKTLIDAIRERIK